MNLKKAPSTNLRGFFMFTRNYGSVENGRPAFHCIGAVFLFPRLEFLVVSAFGFDYFTGVRVLVLLYPACPFGRGAGGADRCADLVVRVNDGDDIFNAFSVFLLITTSLVPS